VRVRLRELWVQDPALLGSLTMPVLFLNDHPVTGGYPVIGVVRTADVDRAAQLQPGQKLTFRWERR